MALCSSGSMSLGGSTVGRSVNCELGCSGTASINMNRSDVRDLAEKSSGAIAMSDFYGKSSFVTPTAFGQCDATWGGIYMGTICAAGSCYYLFVAPNATGCAQCRWKTTRNATAGTSSLTDGFDNTYGPLNNANHPAGNWCATRTIGGFSDWYLPAIDELETIRNNGATGSNQSVIGTGEAFSSIYYWSSTERSATLACNLDFLNGSRTTRRSKTVFAPTRAVRREPI